MGPLARCSIAALLMSASASHAQVHADPDLLDKLQRGDFEAIPRTKVALVDVLISWHAFTDGKCIADSSSDPAMEAAVARGVDFIMRLSRDNRDVIFTAGLLRTTSPNYLAVGLWLDTERCHSPRTQRLLYNIIRLLGSRDSARDWGIGVAAAPPAGESRPPAPTPTRPPAVTTRPAEPARPSRRNRGRIGADAQDWLMRCAAQADAEGVSSYLRGQWCTCIQGPVNRLTPQHAEGLLTDFDRTLAEVRKSDPEEAQEIDRCGTGGRRRPR